MTVGVTVNDGYLLSFLICHVECVVLMSRLGEEINAYFKSEDKHLRLFLRTDM